MIHRKFNRTPICYLEINTKESGAVPMILYTKKILANR